MSDKLYRYNNNNNNYNNNNIIIIKVMILHDSLYIDV